MSSETLAQLLANLPEEERIIMTLHYLKAMSTAEIAALLHVPERSVAAVIASGRSKLTSALGVPHK
jgi:RNA polymerase sigma factor (sigma-70 family)